MISRRVPALVSVVTLYFDKFNIKCFSAHTICPFGLFPVHRTIFTSFEVYEKAVGFPHSRSAKTPLVLA
jgi:hypothetical protein